MCCENLRFETCYTKEAILLKKDALIQEHADRTEERECESNKWGLTQVSPAAGSVGKGKVEEDA